MWKATHGDSGRAAPTTEESLDLYVLFMRYQHCVLIHHHYDCYGGTQCAAKEGRPKAALASLHTEPRHNIMVGLMTFDGDLTSCYAMDIQ